MEVVSEGSRQRLRCRLVVGADGLGSAVARAAGLNRAASVGRKFGFAFDLDCSSAEVIPRDTVEMFVVNGGYLGVVNHGRGMLHVAGLVARRAGIARNPYSFIDSVTVRFERLQQTALNRLDRGHCSQLLAAGPMPWRPWTVANDCVALVGDAAGYVEPFTGEGMSCALESAEALADVLADQSPGAWTAATARRYRRAWRDRVGRRQRICRMLAMGLDREDQVIRRVLVQRHDPHQRTDAYCCSDGDWPATRPGGIKMAVPGGSGRCHAAVDRGAIKHCHTSGRPLGPSRRRT